MRVALIDADILVYESAYRCQHAVEWEPGEYTHAASMPDAQADFAGNIEAILKATDCSRAILALTDSKREENFRKAVWPAYKSHREKPGDGRPLLYKALREWIRETYDVKQKPGVEADDTIGILATGRINGLPGLEHRVICSVDKDLHNVPGWHYNWRKPDEGVHDIDPHWANWFHMMQTLTGDPTDGYPGCPGIGKVRAERLLEGMHHDSLAMWHAVVKAFEKAKLTEADALVQARCARILRASDWDFENNTVRLWEPPKGDHE